MTTKKSSAFGGREKVAAALEKEKKKNRRRINRAVMGNGEPTPKRERSKLKGKITPPPSGGRGSD